MTTPAPHVPCNLLLAGGAGVFSADCVAAFLACNINPEWIGTYGSLSAQAEAASARVAQHEAMLRTGQRRPGATSGGLTGVPVPTMDDRWRAASTVGHLGRDSSHREFGSSRGDNCAAVDGYTERGALSVVAQGSSTTPGTVEHDITQTEERQAEGRGQTNPPRDIPYSADDRRDDQDAIIDTMVDSQQRRFPEGLNDAPMNDGSGVGNDAAVAEDRRIATARSGRADAGDDAHVGPVGEAGSAAVADAGDPDSVPLVDSSNKEGSPSDQAKECLKAYRDALETPQARREAIDQEIARQQARDAGEAQAELDAANDQVAEAQQALADRQAEEAAAIQAHENGVAAGVPPRRERDLEREGLRAIGRTDAAERRLEEAQTRQQQAQQNLPATQIGCLQAARGRLGTDDQRTTGAVPPLQGGG